jgi:hypothetical protein
VRAGVVQEPDGPRPRGTLPEVGRYGGYGLTLGLSTALFAWIGSLHDERFHTGPLFVILGTFTGFAAGFYSMYWHLVLSQRRQPPDKEENRDDE